MIDGLETVADVYSEKYRAVNIRKTHDDWFVYLLFEAVHDAFGRKLFVLKAWHKSRVCPTPENIESIANKI